MGNHIQYRMVLFPLTSDMDIKVMVLTCEHLC